MLYMLGECLDLLFESLTGYSQPSERFKTSLWAVLLSEHANSQISYGKALLLEGVQQLVTVSDR